MKRLIFLVALVLGFALTSSPVLAAKPTTTCNTIQGGLITDVGGNPIKTGFDKWGYNYQANNFNGWYDNYSRPATPATSGDYLSMKWNDAWLSSKDCDKDGKLDRHFGFTTYKDSGAWLTNHAMGTYEGDTYNLTANYVVAFEYGGTTYNHDLLLTEEGGGLLAGSGGYPAGGAYSYAWTITGGTVVGNLVTIDAIYTAGPDAAGTVMHMLGTVALNGSISGTWSDNYQGGERKGTWSTVSGKGTANMCMWNDFVKIVAVPSTAVLDAGKWYTNGSKTTEIGLEIWGEFAIIQEVSSNPCGKELGLLNYKSELRSGLGNW